MRMHTYTSHLLQIDATLSAKKKLADSSCLEEKETSPVVNVEKRREKKPTGTVHIWNTYFEFLRVHGDICESRLHDLTVTERRHTSHGKPRGTKKQQRHY